MQNQKKLLEFQIINLNEEDEFDDSHYFEANFVSYFARHPQRTLDEYMISLESRLKSVNILNKQLHKKYSLFFYLNVWLTPFFR